MEHDRMRWHGCVPHSPDMVADCYLAHVSSLCRRLSLVYHALRLLVTRHIVCFGVIFPRAGCDYQHPAHEDGRGGS